MNVKSVVLKLLEEFVKVRGMNRCKNGGKIKMADFLLD